MPRACSAPPRHPGNRFVFPHIKNAQLLENPAWLKSDRASDRRQSGLFASSLSTPFNFNKQGLETHRV